MGSVGRPCGRREHEKRRIGIQQGVTFREKEEKEEEKEEEEDDDERESNRVAPCATKQVTTPRQWMVVRFVLRPTRPPQWTTWTLPPRRTGRWKETMYMHLPDTSQWPTPFIHPRPPPPFGHGLPPQPPAFAQGLPPRPHVLPPPLPFPLPPHMYAQGHQHLPPPFLPPPPPPNIIVHGNGNIINVMNGNGHMNMNVNPPPPGPTEDI